MLLLILLFVCLAAEIALGLAVAGPAQARTPEPSISLSAKDKSLSDVLAQITCATGCEFEIDPAWEKVAVTANIENEPLSVALKRIIGNRNHAIIYLANNRIKILLYEPNPPGAGPSFSPAMPMHSPSPMPPVSSPGLGVQHVPQSESGVPTQNEAVGPLPPASDTADPISTGFVGKPVVSEADGTIDSPSGIKPPLIRRPIGSALN
jgi:hypothetical protein